jgi:tetratricopeptide (TPR) repeat protein
MTLPRNCLTVVIFGLAVSFAAVGDAQTPSPSLFAVVQAPDHSVIAHEMVKIESAGLGPYETSDSGKFAFPLRANLKVGHEATFRVEPRKSKKWVIISPCDLRNGRKDSLPDVGGPPIEIFAVLWGSPELRKFYSPACIIEEKASNFRAETGLGGTRVGLLLNNELPIFAAQMELRYPGASNAQVESAYHFRVLEAAYRSHTFGGHAGSASERPSEPSNPSRDEFFARKATELGLTVEDLVEGVNAWASSVEDPYEKGLAAFYKGRYAEASRYISESIESSKRDVLKRYVPLARAEFAQGHYAAAEAALRKVLAVHSDDPLVLNNLGVVLTRAANYSEAELLLKRALEVDEKELGREHPDIAAHLGNLAELYRLQERYGEAEALSRRALDIDEKALGPVAPQTATDLHILAEILHAEGHDEKAVLLYRAVIAIDEKQMASERPEDVAMTLNNLAEVYRVHDMYSDAEPLYEKASRIIESSLGPEHPAMGVILNDQGLLYHAQGRDDKAEPLYRRALEIEKSALGPDHPSLALTLDNLGELYRTQQRYSEAETLYKQALAIAEKREPDRWQTAIYLGHLAVLYHAQGKLTEAEPLYKRALAIAEKRLRPDQPDLAVDLGNLALVYKDEGKYADSEPLLRRALAIQNEVLDPDDPALFATVENLVVVLVRLGHETEAKRYKAQAMRISLDLKAMAAHGRGHDAEAETLCKQALASAEEFLGPQDTEVARELYNLAVVYKAEDKNKEAEELLRRALGIEEKARPTDLHVAIISENLAAVLRKLGRGAEAKKYEKQAEQIRAKNEEETTASPRNR